MKRIIKTKLKKLASVLNDLEIDVSTILFAYRNQLHEDINNEWAQFLKKPHILKWTVRVADYENVHGTEYHKDCFIYFLTASVGSEEHIEYLIQCNEEKQCEIDFSEGSNEIFDFATKLIYQEDIDSRESLSKKLDEYIQYYSK